MITCAIIGAGQRGYDIYADYIKRHPHFLKLVAVAEPIDERRNRVIKEYNVDDSFRDYHDLLAKERLADVLIITTQDANHYEPFKLAIEKGYHILLEKPMSNKAEEIAEMEKLLKMYPDRMVAVAHVLRYTPFFETIKAMIDEGKIGKLITIDHNECVGYFHIAHSYVRGNWHCEKDSSPIILAKSCHDLDILLYLTGSHYTKIASFGSLTYFKKENAPLNSGERCIHCNAEQDCPYSALKIYKDMNVWPAEVISEDHTEKGRMDALEHSDYGKCVYKCDNDVCDHEETIISFENGVNATFNLSGFTPYITRLIRVMGSYGEIRGDMDKEIIQYFNFLTGKTETIQISASDDKGHGGGDERFLDAFYDNLETYLETGIMNTAKSSGLISIESHKMAIHAEECRLNHTVYIKK